MVVDDKPGVLSQVAGALAANNISIENLSQAPFENDSAVSDSAKSGSAMLVITTHRASVNAFNATLAELKELEPVRRIVKVLPVEHGVN
jgi:homoserine dehydrogenase